MLQQTLDSLPESQRVAFELIKGDGLSVAQAAETLGTTVTAVKLRAHRTYEALRSALRDASPLRRPACGESADVLQKKVR
jgi:RNA polymerase sigma-70 factor (ECF subfamily)